MSMMCETPPTGQSAVQARSLQEMVPVLKTKRLVLRGPAVSDFEAYAEIACSERGAFIARPQTRDAAWYDFASMVAGWFLHGRGIWTIDDKNNRVLGFVLIGFEPGDQDPELGYMLRAEAEGRGIAFEAARAVQIHAFSTLRLKGMVSYVDPANLRSIALAERLGGQPVGTLSYPGEADSVVYRYIAPSSIKATSGSVAV